MIKTVRSKTSQWLGSALLIGAVGCGAATNDPNGQAAPEVMAPPGSNTLPMAGTGSTGMVPGSMTGAAGTGTTGMVPGSGVDVMEPGTAQGTIPCGAAKVLKSNCQGCHAATPIGGAPMPLVTWADLQKPAKTQPTLKVFQLAQMRLHNTAMPMPPVSVDPLSAEDMTALDSWLVGGALTATGADAMCEGTLEPLPVGSVDGSTGPLEPGPGATCYEFKVHQSTTEIDDQKYDVGDGEHYEQFYYKVPWPAGSVATSYATRMDNAQVLHHWLLFSTQENEVEGFHKTAPLPTLIGTNPVLLAGWAVGGPNLVAPDDVGFELPDPGAQINVQWHFYNATTGPQSDASSVQICTVPKAMRKNLGAITWLGTEDLGGNIWTGGPGMPAGQESTFTTTCVPGRNGIGADESIHIIGFEPHMHRIGKHMKTDVVHLDGSTETLFDKPFTFGSETHYYQDYELKAGEQLVTSCSFNNTNDYGVAFGESSDSEMCYQFVFSWPAHALSNGAFSLLGVPDTCW